MTAPLTTALPKPLPTQATETMPSGVCFSAIATAPPTTAPLVDQPVTERDWQQRAWERLQHNRPELHNTTLDQALADVRQHRIITGFAAQLRREHEAHQAIAAKEAQYGQKVAHNGYGYRRVHKAPK